MHIPVLKNALTDTLIRTRKLCLVQFRTEWSGSCQIMQPVYEEMARYYKGQANFFCVDAELEECLNKQYGIKEFPTILFFKNNQLIDCTTGLISKNKLIAKIENAL